MRTCAVRLGACPQALGFAATISVVLAFQACYSDNPGIASPNEKSLAEAAETGAIAYIEKGDLPAIKKRGKLRILLPRWDNPDFLPRSGFHLDVEGESAKAFAKSLGLEPVEVFVNRHQDLIPCLLKGTGDLIATNLTATESRRKKVAFSLPLKLVREQVIVRADEEGVKGPADLAGRRIAQRPSSSYWGTLVKLKKQAPNLTLEPAPETLDTEQILYGVATGRFDIAVADSNIVEAALRFHANLKVAFDLTGDRPLGWAVRPGSSELLEALNRFFRAEHLASRPRKSYKEDFPGIKTRKVLRVITRNSAATYFLRRGKLMGFDYELAKRFASKHQLRLELIVPPRREDLLPWLLSGKGDLVAASLTATEERENKGIVFSNPYNRVMEIVVSRQGEESLKSPPDLAGRSIVVRRSSSYWRTLEKLKATGIEFKLVPAPEEMETEEIIGRVAEGQYDLTVADSHILAIELSWRNDVSSAFPLGEPVVHGWAIRREDAGLLKAVNDFIDRKYKGPFYNSLHRKYFENPYRIRRHVQSRLKKTGQLSPYDDIVKEYAERYGFDWRLIVAQMYRESQFDPNARSFAGAIGLMQVMPETAEELGFEHPEHPVSNIHAGTKYMSMQWKQLAEAIPEIPLEDRIWFALAAYNAGLGHVFDARRIAAGLKLNPNRWFGHVEKAFPLLSRREYARRARYGYCRGREPVRYVEDIERIYQAYLGAPEK